MAYIVEKSVCYSVVIFYNQEEKLGLIPKSLIFFFFFSPYQLEFYITQTEIEFSLISEFLSDSIHDFSPRKVSHYLSDNIHLHFFL